MTLYEQAVKTYGAESQVRKAVEELTELSVALLHSLDGRGYVVEKEGGMRKRGMSLNRKKLKEKVIRLENENKALVLGLQVLGIAGAVQMEAIVCSYESHLSIAKMQFSEGGIVPSGESVIINNNEGCLLNKEQEQRLRDALSEMINKEIS